MSGDLISRKAAVKIIEDEIKEKRSYIEHNAQIDIMFKIKDMPTAFDVDKVIAELEENADYHYEEAKKYDDAGNDEMSHHGRLEMICFKNAIEIIKSALNQ